MYKNDDVKFTLKLHPDLAGKLNYISSYYGRTRNAAVSYTNLDVYKRQPSAYTGHPNAVGTYGAAPSAGPARVKITGGPLNVRTGASTARPAICQVQQGDTFPVADQDAGWYFIELGAGGGWVSGEYASPVSAEGVIDGRKGA